jgi:hypothetical protein
MNYGLSSAPGGTLMKLKRVVLFLLSIVTMLPLGSGDLST